MHSFLRLWLGVAFLWVGAAVYATKKTSKISSQVPEKLSLEKQIFIYERYLQQLKTFVATFHQYHQDDKSKKTIRSEGVVYVQKPGKLRLVYAPKNTLELIATGEHLIQYDWKKMDYNAIPLKDTPLSLLLEGRNLREIAHVVTLHSVGNKTEILIQSKEDPEAGLITLSFHNAPVRLLGWSFQDSKGKVIRVMLSHIQQNIQINPKTFMLKKAD